MRKKVSLLVLAAAVALPWLTAPDPVLLLEEPGAPAEVPSTGGTLVVDLLDGTSLEDARESTGLDLRWASELSEDEALAVVEVDDLAVAERALQGNPLVEVAEPSMEFSAFGFPDDPMYSQQWNFEKVDAKAGWRAGGGSEVVVAVIDTGVTKVPDLAGTEIMKGVSFVPGVRSSDDDNGHGTHVAGTIAQTTNNGLGVAGLAPNARILPMKVLSSSGMGKSEWIAAAIDDAVDRGADVINMSLGGGHSAVLHNAVDKASERGVLVVVAAGNSGRKGVGCPAHAKGALGVSATGPDDEIAPYSSWGPGVEISAPGGNKTKPGGGILQDTVSAEDKDGHAFRELQGTSMATPHVAGAAAILIGAGASPAEARDLLLSNAEDLGRSGLDEKYGYGRLDIGASLKALFLEHRPILFATGLLAALGLTMLSGTRKRAAVLTIAAVTAGGLFFLPMLPLPPTGIGEVLARPLLQWPEVLVGQTLTRFPLWLSCALPLAATFVFGPTRTLGPAVAGLSAGIGAHLLYGAATGALVPWMLPGALGTVWLVLNGGICLVCAMAALGIAKLRDEAEVRA